MALCALAIIPFAQAQPWTSFDDNTRYLALGDSLSAGYGAKPATQGFVYQLYQSGVIDNLNNMLFCTIAVPYATSAVVLAHQVPQASLFLAPTGKSYKKVITLTVGGNDVSSVMAPDGTVNPALVPAMLAAYGGNLTAILTNLATSFPDAKIYVGNLYDPRLPIPGADILLGLMNGVTAAVVSGFPGHAVLVDLNAAFDGRSGLLLSEKPGAGPDQVHPTNAGYRAIAKAFEDAIRAN